MMGKVVEKADEEKDLGVWLNTTLKPTKQCEVAARMANMTLGQIQRAFHYRRKEYLIPLYKTFVRPKLEFGVAAWNPWTEADAEALEKVQKRALRLITDISGTTYLERLEEVGLTTLKERRERGDAIEAFKTLKGFNRVKKDKWFEVSGPEARATRRTANITEEGEERRTDSLERKVCRLETRKNFFTVRAVPMWNEIPDGVRNQKTINAFKNAFDRWKRNKTSKQLTESRAESGEANSEAT